MTRKNDHQEIDASADLEKIRDRRRALKNIAAGGTIAAGTSLLPGKWVSPVVDRIMVPAHAQTSVTTTKAPTTTTATTTTTTTTPCPDDISADYGDANRWYYAGTDNAPYYYQINLIGTTGGLPPYTYAVTGYTGPELNSACAIVDEDSGSVMMTGCKYQIIITVTDANGCTGESIVPLMAT